MQQGHAAVGSQGIVGLPANAAEDVGGNDWVQIPPSVDAILVCVGLCFASTSPTVVFINSGALPEKLVPGQGVPAVFQHQIVGVDGYMDAGGLRLVAGAGCVPVRRFPISEKCRCQKMEL
jgi:hypothetical protein